MTKWIEAREVPALLKPGMHVFVGGSVMEPLALLAALKDAPEASRGVTYITNPVPGLSRIDYATFHPDARVLTNFMSDRMQKSFAEGKIDFIPIQYHQRYMFVGGPMQIDAALVQYGPPDSDGMCSPGYGIDFVPLAVDRAKLVIAEINEALPAPPGLPKTHISKFHYAVKSNTELQLLRMPPFDVVSRQIGANVAGLVRDGDCIEMGVGAIPNAALDALRGRNDLGVHSGMISDGVMHLANAGVINGRMKTLDKGKIVTGIVAGSNEVMKWAGHYPDIVYRTVDYTHDVALLGRIDNFVAINGAVEVDLLGQLNSEMVGGRQISGTGGSVDFMRGALRSKGGRGIVAFTATAGGGKISRIVPAISGDAVVTALRTDADHFVTEYGVAKVRGQPLQAAAEALIAIAAPQFRDGLRDAWKERFRRITGA
jgi:4-hydroxybutyrate CoA-transferase